MSNAEDSLQKDGALLRDLHHLAGLLQNDEIVKKIPNFPWPAASQNWAQSTIRSLEDQLLSGNHFEGNGRKLNEQMIGDSNLFEMLIMERKSELEAIETKLIELQVEEEIMSKRFTTSTLHTIPSNVEQLTSTFISFRQHLTQLMGSECITASDGTSVKAEEGMANLQHSRTNTSTCSNFLWSQADVLKKFNLVQGRELLALAKYCQCILKQGFITNSPLKYDEGHDCSNTRDFSQPNNMNKLSTSADREVPIDVSDGSSVDHYSELHKLNEIYGELQQRKIKQLTANGALSAALKQMKTDCCSFNIETDALNDDEARNCAPLSPRSNKDSSPRKNRDVVDFPSTVQLRSELLRRKEKIESLKKDIETQIEELKTGTDATSSTRTFPFTRANTELKRHKLSNLLQQQEKVIDVLKSMKKRGVDVGNMLKKEKNMFDQAELHAQNVTTEFNQIKESFEHLELAFGELQLGKVKRKPLTVHPDDHLCRLIYDMFLQDELTMKTDAVTRPIKQESLPGFNMKDECKFANNMRLHHDGDQDASLDSKQWSQNVFSDGKEFFGNSTVTCDGIMKHVAQLDREIIQLKGQLERAIGKKRCEVVKQYEMIQNSGSIAVNSKPQMSRDADERLEMKKSLKRLEMGIGAHLEHWCRHRQQTSSNPQSRKEDEAFVDFFAHPNRAALNIKRWKSEQV